MGKNVVWTACFALIAGLLQSTLLVRLSFYHMVPDLALGIVIYSAYVNGAMTGQLAGFFSGLLMDLLSASPLGLHAFTGTLAGALAGAMKGTFFLNVFFLPMALCAGATMVKGLAFLVLHFFLGTTVPVYPLFSPIFWVELLLNTVLAPLLFALLKLFGPLLVQRRET